MYKINYKEEKSIVYVIDDWWYRLINIANLLKYLIHRIIDFEGTWFTEASGNSKANQRGIISQRAETRNFQWKSNDRIRPVNNQLAIKWKNYLFRNYPYKGIT